MTRTWERVEPAIMVAGDVGGDWQTTEAYTARWALKLEADDPAARLDGSPTHAVVDCTYYGAVDEEAAANGNTVRVIYTFVLTTDVTAPYDHAVDLPLEEDFGVEEPGDGYVVDLSDSRIREFVENDETPTVEFWNEHVAEPGDEGRPWMALVDA